jgi:hypothetical protein
VPVQGEPDTRRLSLDNAGLPGPDWIKKYASVAVRGNEDGLGQALVCIETLEFFNKDQVEQMAAGAGCTVVPRDEVKSKLVAPYQPFIDESGNIKFYDGQDGREMIVKPDPDVSHINDSAVK